MSHLRSRCRMQPVVIVLFLAILVSWSMAGAYDLTVRVTDTTVSAGATSGWLTVYLTNSVDSIAGFQIWLQLDRPDLIQLGTTVDTAGSVISGFEYLDTRSIALAGTDLQITALSATIPPVPPARRGFGPSPLERVLCRIPFTIPTPVPDTTTNRTAHVYFNSSFLPKFNFSRPDGTLIGLKHNYLEDSICFHCQVYQDQVCLQWVQSAPPCDSVAYTTDTVAVLDTTKVHVVNGAVAISTAPCFRTVADFDIDSNGVSLSVADYVALVLYVHGDTSVHVNPYAADINGDCRIDWRDGAFLDSLFTHGLNCDPGPCRFSCGCDHVPVRSCCWRFRGNLSNDPGDVIDGADLAALVGFLTGGGTTIPCSDEGNVDGKGITDGADLAYLVAYLVAQGPEPAPCP